MTYIIYIGYVSNTIPLGYELLGKTFPFVDSELYQRVGLDTYICPVNKNYYISGNLISDHYTVLQIRFKKWTGSNWKCND